MFYRTGIHTLKTFNQATFDGAKDMCGVSLIADTHPVLSVLEYEPKQLVTACLVYAKKDVPVGMNRYYNNNYIIVGSDHFDDPDSIVSFAPTLAKESGYFHAHDAVRYITFLRVHTDKPFAFLSADGSLLLVNCEQFKRSK